MVRPLSVNPENVKHDNPHPLLRVGYATTHPFRISSFIKATSGGGASCNTSQYPPFVDKLDSESNKLLMINNCLDVMVDILSV